MALSDDEGLREACQIAQQTMQESKNSREWGDHLTAFLDNVKDADRETRSSKTFQEKLWNDNPVSAVGQGDISVAEAIADDEFRHWLADRSLAALPASTDERTILLQTLFDEIAERLSRFSARSPRLKIARVLAAFYPRDFTTIAHGYKLRKLHQAMGQPRGANIVARHANVLARLNEVIGTPADDTESIAERMRLPWHLYERFVAGAEDDATELPQLDSTGLEKLRPLPAERRRRGLTGMAGGLANMLNILEFSRDGVSRDDLIAQIRSLNPAIKEVTAKVTLNVLATEYNVIRWAGSRYELTSRGEAFLESADPDELVDWILTRILAADHVLVWLRDRGAIAQSDLLKLTQSVNPGWTTNFAPGVLLSCLRQLKLIEQKEGQWTLTDSGKAWAARIDWVPETLPKQLPDGLPLLDSDSESTSQRGRKATVELPSLSDIRSAASAVGAFADGIVAKLHAGLWSHKRRHFAVLTGISGAGKTLLATTYARAIAGIDGNDRILVLPVQPGWYDPAPLLGYINPLQPDAYVRTSCLEFLIRAAGDPERPHTLVLDEMNLSRPEQYLAPILSAMETGEALVLHQEGDVLDGVPNALVYPSNLVIIGTVNMDETTHGLSDKVLDRAFTLPFWDIDMSQYPKWGKRELPQGAEQQTRALLEALMNALRPARLHFGWRTVDDVFDYLVTSIQHGGEQKIATILDGVIYAKVLPKLRGDDSMRFRNALKDCYQILADHGLGDCARKVEELQLDLETTGSARFWR
jgi:5-methylcytosine-specific restriction enzyme B